MSCDIVVSLRQLQSTAYRRGLAWVRRCALCLGLILPISPISGAFAACSRILAAIHHVGCAQEIQQGVATVCRLDLLSLIRSDNALIRCTCSFSSQVIAVIASRYKKSFQLLILAPQMHDRGNEGGSNKVCGYDCAHASRNACIQAASFKAPFCK